MDQDKQESFKLSTGGLFYSALVAVGVHKREAYSVRRRIFVLSSICLIPLLILVVYEGNLYGQHIDMPFLNDMSVYVRYLIVLPVLVFADALIDPLIDSNIKCIRESGVVGKEDLTAYQNAVEKLEARKDSRLADIIIIMLIGFIIYGVLTNLEEFDASTDYTNWLVAQGLEKEMTYAGWWSLLVSFPLLQILLYRWIWRFYLWASFLFSVSRIELNLQPTHPDLNAGLGILKNGESAFILLFLSIGALLSSSLAEEIIYTDMTLTQAQPVILVYVVLALFIMSLPLTFFSYQLIIARRRGRIIYGSLGYRLSESFDKKWRDISNEEIGNQLIQTADPSAVCDYADIYGAVKEMEVFPVSAKSYVKLALIMSVPFMPLVFTEMPVTEVITRILSTIL